VAKKILSLMAATYPEERSLTMSKIRFRALIGIAVLGVAAALVTLLAVPATPAHVSTRSTLTVIIPCKPAYELTPQQRAALLASMPGGNGIRTCSPGTSTAVHLVAFHKFLGKRTFQLTNVQLSDSSCDGRSTYADITTNNGFIEEFVNNQGCNHDAIWPGPIKKTDVSDVKYVYVRLYACGNPVTSGCSSVVPSKYHYNHYTVPSLGTINSTFNFCNKTGPRGATIACFYADLD
jgi:hypothetical protein